MPQMGPVKPSHSYGAGDMKETAQPGAQPAVRIPPSEGMNTVMLETGKPEEAGLVTLEAVRVQGLGVSQGQL